MTLYASISGMIYDIVKFVIVKFIVWRNKKQTIPGILLIIIENFLVFTGDVRSIRMLIADG
jgi:hypothetical protein